MSREERKAEQRLKALLKEPCNKRCINCDSLGPQYVVSNFNVFVCTVCSGVHRQFGHRVKGVSMSTFKPDEVAALADSGNARFAAYYLHKWTTAALPKPVDRDVHRIHTWIGAVYQDRKFYGEPAGGWTPTPGGAASTISTTSTEGHEPVVRPLSEVLGSDAPRLHVQGSGSGLQRSISAVSSNAGASTPSKAAAAAAAAATGAAGAASPSGLLDLSSPKSAKAAAPAAAAAPAWDPFGDHAQAAAAASGSPEAARPAAAPAAEAGWAAFGDAPASPVQRQQQPAAAAAAPAAAQADEGSGWEAFGSGPSSPTAHTDPAAAPAVAAAAGSAGNGTTPSSAGSSPPKQRQPVRSTSRPEVPMDVFYPEFEQIRATGMLPTGKPVPLPPFPPAYSLSAGHHPAGHPAAPPPAGAQPFKSYSYPTAAQQQQQLAAGGYGAPQQHMAAGGYGVPQRPTIAIPPAPQQPGYGYSGVSPPAGRPGMPSPGAYSSSGYSPAGSIVSPAGSGFSSAVSHPGPGTNGSAYGSFTHQDAAAAALRSSAGSLSDLMPGSAAPTPGPAAPGHRLGEAAVNDPFAGLAPGLRSALPAVPQSSSSKFGGAPPPTPAGGPPFGSAAVNGGAVAHGGMPAAGPFAGAPAASPAGLAPATAAASATLFGRTPSLTGYDLSAPAAPKPASSGNPFA